MATDRRDAMAGNGKRGVNEFGWEPGEWESRAGGWEAVGAEPEGWEPAGWGLGGWGTPGQAVFDEQLEERIDGVPVDLEVGVAVASWGTAFMFTDGLWRRGIPELYLLPTERPEVVPAAHTTAQARIAVTLAAGLLRLGTALLDAHGADVGEVEVDHDGRPVRFWLVGPEAPQPWLSGQLGPEVHSVIRVDCSLWHAPFFGEEQPH